MLAHKDDTEECHRGLSAASFATLPQHHSLYGHYPYLFGRPHRPVSGGIQRKATLGIDVGGILLTWPIHLHRLFFTSGELRIGYLVWPKDVQNSSKALVLEYFPHVTHSFSHLQDSAAYSNTLITLFLKMRIFVFLLIIFVFQMFFRAANAPLALLIVVLISASVFPSFVTLAPRYVNSVTSSMSCSPSLTGSAV